MSKIEIIENFLPQREFKVIENIFYDPSFPWYFQPYVDFHPTGGYNPDVNIKDRTFQFAHMFYHENEWCSSHGKPLLSILNKFKILALLRIKTNLTTVTPTITEHRFHTDIIAGGDWSGHKLNEITTAIFYINTNDGYTKFKDGTKVESVANTLVKFPSNTMHLGTTCTNRKSRIVINFNFLEFTPMI